MSNKRSKNVGPALILGVILFEVVVGVALGIALANTLALMGMW